MRIIFPLEVYQRFRAYIDSVPGEISGFGRISMRHGIITIEEVRIFNQICSAGHTKQDQYAIGEFWNSLEDPSGWKLWWHSHADMQAYFSSTDDRTIEEADMQTQEDNWQLSIVSNHRGDIKSRLDQFAPFRYTIEDIAWDIDFSNKRIDDEVFEEVSRKVQIFVDSRAQREKKPRVNDWGDRGTQIRLPAVSTMSPQGESSVILNRHGMPYSADGIDPEDIKKHPELFGRKKKHD